MITGTDWLIGPITGTGWVIAPPPLSHPFYTKELLHSLLVCPLTSPNTRHNRDTIRKQEERSHRGTSCITVTVQQECPGVFGTWFITSSSSSLHMGSTMQRNKRSSSPVFFKYCTAPGGTKTALPGLTSVDS